MTLNIKLLSLLDLLSHPHSPCMGEISLQTWIVIKSASLDLED